MLQVSWNGDDVLKLAVMKTHKLISEAQGKDVALSLLVIGWAIGETNFKGRLSTISDLGFWMQIVQWENPLVSYKYRYMYKNTLYMVY